MVASSQGPLRMREFYWHEDPTLGLPIAFADWSAQMTTPSKWLSRLSFGIKVPPYPDPASLEVLNRSQDEMRTCLTPGNGRELSQECLGP